MSGSWFLAAHWGPRQEAVDDCAARMATCLEGLASTDPAFTAWYRKARRRPASPERVDLDAQNLVELLRSGVNRKDGTGEPIPELGFSVGLWNGDDAASVSLRVSCGTTTDVVPNVFVLGLPGPSQRPSLYAAGVARRLLDAVVSAWQPDWASFGSHDLLGPEAPPTGPMVGWLTYLSRSRDVPSVTPVGRLDRRDDGVVIELAPEVGDVDRDAVRRLTETLRAAGCLGPTS